MVDLTIDGKAVNVPAGTTILEAAQNIGIDIPNLCYDKDLTVFGGCRMCVVEVEGARNLQTACSTPVIRGWSSGRNRSVWSKHAA
jgi:NADH-quinone oxidoreductase subunit G